LFSSAPNTDINVYTIGLQPFHGTGPHQLLCAGSWAAHGNIVSGILYLLTPWSILLQKLTGSRLVKTSCIP